MDKIIFFFSLQTIIQKTLYYGLRNIDSLPFKHFSMVYVCLFISTELNVGMFIVVFKNQIEDPVRITQLSQVPLGKGIMFYFGFIQL